MKLIFLIVNKMIFLLYIGVGGGMDLLRLLLFKYLFKKLFFGYKDIFGLY